MKTYPRKKKFSPNGKPLGTREGQRHQMILMNSNIRATGAYRNIF